MKGIEVRYELTTSQSILVREVSQIWEETYKEYVSHKVHTTLVWTTPRIPNIDRISRLIENTILKRIPWKRTVDSL